jgi:hypothetical protein
MTRTISLIVILALAGLALVPAALGNHQYRDAFVGAQQVDFWNYDRQTGAKIANTSPGVAPRDLAALYTAKGSRLAGKMDRPSRGGDPWLAQERRDLSAEAPRALAARAPATSSGDELEWLQIGMGLGGGILLAFGLFLGLRLVRIRALAH